MHSSCRSDHGFGDIVDRLPQYIQDEVKDIPPPRVGAEPDEIEEYVMEISGILKRPQAFQHGLTAPCFIHGRDCQIWDHEVPAFPSQVLDVNVGCSTCVEFSSINK